MYKKVTIPITVLANGILAASMSMDEAKKQLKQLEDPEIAKQVGMALKKMKAGDIEAALADAAIKTLLIALQVFMGSLFADSSIKNDLALKLRGPVKLEDLTQIKQTAEDIKKEVDEVNKAIKDKSGMTKPGTTIVRIGDQKLVAKNEHEYKVLKAMVKLDSALKRNKAKGFISDETYKDRIAALVEAFNKNKSVVFSS